MELSAEAVRVLGCLVEKERTVPDSYPLTLNSLVTACNQSSNRWPVVQYDSGKVQRTLDDLKNDGFVRFVHPSHGERTTKFRHVLGERLGLEPGEVAVLALLALRGPQTAAELRARADRLHAFGSTGEVEAALHSLATREDPLAQQLSRRPGERESRWIQLLGGSGVEDSEISHSLTPERATPGLDARVAALEAQVARLYELLGEEPPAS
jgi:uncharacterized protein YceH (UPF0502 family)